MNTKPTRIALFVSMLCAGANAWAVPPANSPYMTDPYNEYVQDATSDGIDNLNMVLCIMNSMRPADMVNAGPYVALVDKNKCDARARSSTSNSSGNASGATTAPSYMNAVVDVTRASNTDPMIGKVWMSFTENGNAVDVSVYINAQQSPTDAPPYGKFRLDYIGKVNGATQFNGYIDTLSAGVLKYLETGQNSSNVALALSASSTTAGAGTMTIANPNPAQFDFAYNTDYFRRSDGTADQCFDRLKANADRSVWRYGTYNANDGTRVDMANPGFPIKATYQSNTYYGFANYYGINFQGLDLNQFPDAQPLAGFSITDQRQGNTTAYNLSKVGGKLTRWDQSSATLDQLDGVPVNFWGDLTTLTSGALTLGNWQMHWDKTAARFVVTGQQVCNGNCVVTDLSSAVSLPTSAFSAMPISGWSDSFGGNLNIPPTNANHAGTDAVYYYTQSNVIPGSTSLTLYCLSQCPTAASVAAAQSFTGGTPASPFGAGTDTQWFSAPSSANTVTYAFDAHGLENNGGSGNVPMVVTNAAYFQSSSQFNWGLSSGRLFTTPFANCMGSNTTVCEPSNPATYYTWQTGPNNWNQSLWLTNAGSNAVVSFDAPQNIAYTVPTGTAYGTWAGKSIMLQFNGFGNLFGIPGNCVNPVDNSPVDCSTANARYVPSFALPDGATMTLSNPSTPLIVRALDAELRLKAVPLATCSALSLSPLTPPSGGTTDPSATNGTKPVVTAPPKVIDGVIQ